jgi:hypothetical protein
MALIASLQGDPHGARVLRLLADPRAESRRSGRRGPRVEGPLEGVAVTADAIVDLASGRIPRRIDLVGPGPATELADELRRRHAGTWW